MKSEGKVRVVIRSRKVPVGTVLHTEPVFSPSGVLVGWKPNRLVLYGRSVDEDNRRTVQEAEKLASNLGLGLEIVDESRWGLFIRFLSGLGRNGRRLPSIVVSPAPVMVSSDPSYALSHDC